MKIAGRKNDGAWFRANAYIQTFTADTKTALKAAIAGSDYIDAFRNAIQNIAIELGQEADELQDNETYADVLVTKGIPRQVWYGKLSFTLYDRVVENPGPDEVVSYVPRGQSEAHYFAKDLRKIVTRFIFGTRQVADIADIGRRGEGNPGGLPNADEDDIPNG